MSQDIMDQILERIVRESYGRFLSILSFQSRDIAQSEDVLSEALLEALKQWGSGGIPDNPEAWLLAVARRRMIDHYRRKARWSQIVALWEEPADLLDASGRSRWVGPADHRVELLFVCAHPAIDSEIQVALMMNVVLGLSAESMSGSFLMSPRAMSQRLVRAKRKIRDSGIPFVRPSEDELPDRLGRVMDSLYGAFHVGWETVPGGEGGSAELSGDVIRLVRLIHEWIPGNAELMGLLALMLYAHSRAAARHGAHNPEFVPLDNQDISLWDTALITEAESLMLAALKLGNPGLYQLEACIQSAHLDRLRNHISNWHEIGFFYDQIISLSPSIGAWTARAGVHVQMGQHRQAVDSLQKMDAAAVRNYQPWWLVLALAHQGLGEVESARSALQRAIGLTSDPSVRKHLLSLFRL